MMRRMQWRELPLAQRVATLLLGAVQFLLFGAAQIDIRRRPAGEIRGSKWFWTAVSFVNFAGPIAYFLFGRRR